MGSDLIKLSDAIEALHGRKAVINSAYDAIAAIRTVPIIDRPKGEWEEVYDEDEHPLFRHRWKCSECGVSQTYGKPDFCPNCGARMKGASDEHDK